MAKSWYKCDIFYYEGECNILSACNILLYTSFDHQKHTQNVQQLKSIYTMHNLTMPSDKFGGGYSPPSLQPQGVQKSQYIDIKCIKTLILALSVILCKL